jgi:hypothetical protein
MVNISQSNGMRTMFIRFNPDSYKAPGGVAVEASRRRLDVLLEWIRHHMNVVPKDFLSVLYLYFDGYEYGREEVQVVLADEEAACA